MQPHYVPNYYFNQIRRDTPPDLFQVKERRVNAAQMFDEKDRAQQRALLYQQQEREMRLRQRQIERMHAQQMNEYG